MKNPGYIYIAFNPEMPHCLKIGYTSRSPHKRLNELSNTSTPVPYRLLMQWRVTNTIEAERRAHQALAEFRVASNREFFRVEGPDAIQIVGKAIEGYFPKTLESEMRQKITSACNDIAKQFFEMNYLSVPPSKTPPDIVDELEKQIRDSAIFHAKWSADEGRNPDIILSVLELISVSLHACVFNKSPTKVAQNLKESISILMSLTSVSLYSIVEGVELESSALAYAAEVTNSVSSALRDSPPCD